MSVTVNTRRLDVIIRNAPGNVAEVIETIAFAVERRAKEMAPVDTGALKSSIFTKTKRGGRQPNQRDGVVYVDLPEPENDTQAIVGPTVDYGIWQELGTSRTAAQPYLVPAVEAVASSLERYRGDFGKALTDG